MNGTNNPFADGQNLSDWYFHDTNVNISDCSAPNAGFLNNKFQNVSMFVTARSQYASATIFGINFDISIDTQCSLTSPGNPAHPSSINGDNVSGFIISAGRLSAIGGNNNFLDNIDLSSSSGDAIIMEWGCQALLGSVTGAGNTGFGINITNAGGVASINQNGGITTVTGGAGDIQVGSTVVTYAGPPPQVPFSEVDASGPDLQPHPVLRRRGGFLLLVAVVAVPPDDVTGLGYRASHEQAGLFSTLDAVVGVVPDPGDQRAVIFTLAFRRARAPGDVHVVGVQAARRSLDLVETRTAVDAALVLGRIILVAWIAHPQ